MIYESHHYSDCPDWPLRHFTPKEVSDSRTGEVKLWVPFGLRMDELRDLHGQPIHVTSWYRTPEHDRDIGGKGNHSGGWAADIYSNNMYELLHDVCAQGFAGLGVAKSFIHVDDNEDYMNRGKRPALWTYK